MLFKQAELARIQVEEVTVAFRKWRRHRLDQASRTGPWTRATLEAIEGGEGIRAGDLAPVLGQQKDTFKLNVRKLKKLGLTESLGTGYRVSSRGQAVLEKLRGPEAR